MAFTVHQLSLLALAVYENPSSGIDGWRLVRQFGSFTDGFYGALFAKDRTLALALRGTDDGWDIIPDLLIFMGHLPDQYAHATAAYNRSASYIGAGGMFKNFAVTGHSLGERVGRFVSNSDWSSGGDVQCTGHLAISSKFATAVDDNYCEHIAQL